MANKAAERVMELEAEVAALKQEVTTLRDEARPCYEPRVYSDTYRADLVIPARYRDVVDLVKLVAELHHEDANKFSPDAKGERCHGWIVGTPLDLASILLLFKVLRGHIMDGGVRAGLPVPWALKIEEVIGKQRRPALN